MTFVSSDKDPEALTITMVAEFDAPVEEVWKVWEDPRKLERWWGPPTWPSTFVRHEFREGGQSRYYMTGPEGEKSAGYWTITAIDAPRRLEFTDGFAGDDGEPLPDDVPVHGVVTFEENGGRTRMTSVTRFADAEQLEKLAAMGMEEGMREAMSQIDAVLAGDSARVS